MGAQLRLSTACVQSKANEPQGFITKQEIRYFTKVNNDCDSAVTSDSICEHMLRNHICRCRLNAFELQENAHFVDFSNRPFRMTPQLRAPCALIYSHSAVGDIYDVLLSLLTWLMSLYVGAFVFVVCSPVYTRHNNIQQLIVSQTASCLTMHHWYARCQPQLG